MKIGIDYAATIGYGGNSVYSQNLIDAILAVDTANEYYLYSFAHDVLRGSIRQFKDNKKIHLRPVYFSALGLPIPDFIIIWINHISFRFWSAIDGLDLFHFTNPIYYEKGRYKRLIVTIHDLGSLHNDNWSKKESAVFLKEKIKEMIFGATKVVAVSEYTKKDIINFFNIDSGKIHVVYEAAASVYFSEIRALFMKEKFGVEKYLLYVGQLQPRKNIINMLLAYAQLSDSLKETYALVLVGRARDKNYSDRINETIKENNLATHVKILGRLEDDAIRVLHSGARAFVFPSLFEGFGLPVLEALQCGTPVITSNTTSLPEVAGDAGILIDPTDVGGLSGAMQEILVNEDLYGNLKNRCLRQAKKFSWQKAAKETIDVYEQCRHLIRN